MIKNRSDEYKNKMENDFIMAQKALTNRWKAFKYFIFKTLVGDKRH